MPRRGGRRSGRSEKDRARERKREKEGKEEDKEEIIRVGDYIFDKEKNRYFKIPPNNSSFPSSLSSTSSASSSFSSSSSSSLSSSPICNRREKSRREEGENQRGSLGYGNICVSLRLRAQNRNTSIPKRFFSSFFELLKTRGFHKEKRRKIIFYFRECIRTFGWRSSLFSSNLDSNGKRGDLELSEDKSLLWVWNARSVSLHNIFWYHHQAPYLRSSKKSEWTHLSTVVAVRSCPKKLFAPLAAVGLRGHGGYSGRVEVTNATGEILSSVSIKKSSLFDCQWSCSANFLAMGVSKKCVVHDVEQQKLIHCWSQHADVFSVCTHPVEEQLLFGGTRNGKICLIDLRCNPKTIGTFSQKFSSISCIKVLERVPHQLLSRTADGEICLWDIRTSNGKFLWRQNQSLSSPSPTRKFCCPSSRSSCTSSLKFDVSEDQGIVLGSYEDGTIAIWDLKNGVLLNKIQTISPPIQNLQPQCSPPSVLFSDSWPLKHTTETKRGGTPGFLSSSQFHPITFYGIEKKK